MHPLSPMILSEVSVAATLPIVTGGSAEARTHSLTLEQLRERIVGSAMDPARFDNGMSCFHDPDFWCYGAAMLSVTGRRPPRP